MEYDKTNNINSQYLSAVYDGSEDILRFIVHLILNYLKFKTNKSNNWNPIKIKNNIYNIDYYSKVIF